MLTLLLKVASKVAKTNVNDLNNQQFLYDLAKAAYETAKAVIGG